RRNSRIAELMVAGGLVNLMLRRSLRLNPRRLMSPHPRRRRSQLRSRRTRKAAVNRKAGSKAGMTTARTATRTAVTTMAASADSG
ncbi:MAG: hypothetical protein ABI740_08900, partial [Alphaproteobacteria bacterium]